MEIKNINLSKNTFQKYFVYRHLRNWSIVSIPLMLVMVIFAFVARTISIGFDFVGVCFLITILLAVMYVYSIIKISKSYENKPYDLLVEKGIYEIKRRNEKNKLVTTFKKDLKDFQCYDENKLYFFLFPEKNTTFILPKDLFNSENLRYFEAQIKKKVTRKRTPWFSRILNTILSISAIAFSCFFLVGILG